MTDKFNNEDLDPQQKHIEEDPLIETEVKISNPQMMWETGKNFLTQSGIFVYTNESSLGGIEIRNLEPLRPVKGVTYPKPDFSIQVPKSLSVCDVSNKLAQQLEILSLTKPDVAKFWNPVVNPPVGGILPKIHQAAYNSYRDISDMECSKICLYCDGVSLLGNEGCLRLIPQQSWFNEELKKYTPNQIIPFFPKAELDYFMLHMGRAMVGRDNSSSMENKEINHTYRNMCILVGNFEAGMGKSTLMGYLLDAMKFLGYTTATLHDNDRFGWGEIARSDIAYIDDLTPDQQRKLISSPIIKQVVSNGQISTEKKGIDPVQHRSKTTLIGCSNSFNPKDYYGMDAGMISRIKFLHTMQSAEMEDYWDKTSPNKLTPDYAPMRIKEMWRHISEKTNTEPLGIAMYFLSLCSEHFLRVTGHLDVEGNILNKKDDDKDFLFDYVKTTSNKLIIQPNGGDNLNLLAPCLLVLVICEALSKHDETFHDEITNLINSEKGLNYRELTLLMLNVSLKFWDYFSRSSKEKKKVMLLRSMRMSEYHTDYHSLKNPFLFLDLINGYSVEVLNSKLQKFSQFNELDEDLVKFVFSNIRNNKGYKLVGEINWLHGAWVQIQSYKSHYAKIVNYAIGLEGPSKESEEKIRKNLGILKDIILDITSDLSLNKNINKKF